MLLKALLLLAVFAMIKTANSTLYVCVTVKISYFLLEFKLVLRLIKPQLKNVSLL